MIGPLVQQVTQSIRWLWVACQSVAGLVDPPVSHGSCIPVLPYCHWSPNTCSVLAVATPLQSDGCSYSTFLLTPTPGGNKLTGMLYNLTIFPQW